MKIDAKILGGAILVVAIVVILVVLAPNLSKKQQEEVSPTQEETTEETTPGEETTTEEETTPGEETTETLGEILSKAGDIASVKYDLIMTSEGMPSTTQKVWLKKNKMKTETTVEKNTQISIIDMDAKTIYMYLPAQNIATKMDFSDAPESPIESVENVENYNPVVIGSETIDGKACIVYEVTVEGTKVKYWVWKERGFPIKVEAETSEGKVTTEYKNIEFEDIPDSVFELPKGVQIMDFPTE